jgi:Xaa-Pro aminopeptidase
MAESNSAHLALLREELARRGLDGFVVPRADEHQGEYVPPCAERLAWITGFTGSAGIAVVLAERAALFVDGRYTLQGAAETAGSDIEVVHVTEKEFDDWLADALAPEARLGYDARLHTGDGRKRLEKACKRAGAILTASDGNAVDAIWQDRPAPPLAPVVAHGTEFAGRSSADKRSDIGQALAKEDCDAAVITLPDSVAWLLNLRGGDVPHTPLPLGFAILARDGDVALFMDPRKLSPGLDQHLGNSVAVQPPDGLGPALRALGEAGKTVRADPATASAWVLDELATSGAKLAEGPDLCIRPKAIKNATELAGTRAAHRRDGVAVSRFLHWLSNQAPSGALSEIAASDHLEALRREGEHFRDLSFPTISGAAANGAIVHYRVTPESDRALETGSLYLVDSGAQYLDGTTDITRTVAIGEPSAEMRDRFTRVLKGHIALATVRFPVGTRGSQLDTLARLALWQAGLDYDHGTGHGVGSYLSVHEGPQRISKRGGDAALAPGMILSNEPGYYKTGAYGIRIENLLAVTAVEAPEGAERELLGFETLTRAPIDRALVDVSLLDDGEVAWLDTYHTQVRETLTPLLDPECASWLAGATTPLA